VVNEFLSSARAQGLGEQDFAILYTVLAHMSGIAWSSCRLRLRASRPRHRYGGC